MDEETRRNQDGFVPNVNLRIYRVVKTARFIQPAPSLRGCGNILPEGGGQVVNQPEITGETLAPTRRPKAVCASD